jgi:ferredoxin
LQILTKITDGQADQSDMEMLEELSQTVKDASQCGLGKTAPNPILSTMKYFQDEYQSHVRGKKCTAGVCKPLFTYEIAADKCKACGKCKPSCPVGAIEGEVKVVHTITPDKCTKCGACYDTCPFDAVTKV